MGVLMLVHLFTMLQQYVGERWRTGRRTIQVVPFQIRKTGRWNEYRNVYNNSLIYINNGDVPVVPIACPPNYITINKNDRYSECETRTNTQTNFYTFSSTNSGNKNTCVNFNNIVSLPGQYLRMNNGRLENV